MSNEHHKKTAYYQVANLIREFLRSQKSRGCRREPLEEIETAMRAASQVPPTTPEAPPRVGLDDIREGK